MEMAAFLTGASCRQGHAVPEDRGADPGRVRPGLVSRWNQENLQRLIKITSRDLKPIPVVGIGTDTSTEY